MSEPDLSKLSSDELQEVLATGKGELAKLKAEREAEEQQATEQAARNALIGEIKLVTQELAYEQSLRPSEERPKETKTRQSAAKKEGEN